jgi:hypothetical protein
MSMQKLDG